MYMHIYLIHTRSFVFFSNEEGGILPPPKKKSPPIATSLKLLNGGMGGGLLRSFLLCKYKSHYQLHQFSYNSIWPVYDLFQFPLIIIFKRTIHCFLKYILFACEQSGFIHTSIGKTSKIWLLFINLNLCCKIPALPTKQKNL